MLANILLALLEAPALEILFMLGLATMEAGFTPLQVWLRSSRASRGSSFTACCRKLFGHPCHVSTFADVQYMLRAVLQAAYL